MFAKYINIYVYPGKISFYPQTCSYCITRKFPVPCLIRFCYSSFSQIIYAGRVLECRCCIMFRPL